MFKLSAARITANTVEVEPCSGAIVTFEGVVRNENEGRPVMALQYEAMEELACKEGERILDEAAQRFEIDRAECVHRTGLLNVGETAIIVRVAAGHRQAAFEACRYIVDEVKARVPIWKKEFYESGEAGWINAGNAPPS